MSMSSLAPVQKGSTAESEPLASSISWSYGLAQNLRWRLARLALTLAIAPALKVVQAGLFASTNWRLSDSATQTRAALAFTLEFAFWLAVTAITWQVSAFFYKWLESKVMV